MQKPEMSENLKGGLIIALAYIGMIVVSVIMGICIRNTKKENKEDSSDIYDPGKQIVDSLFDDLFRR